MRHSGGSKRPEHLPRQTGETRSHLGCDCEEKRKKVVLYGLCVLRVCVCVLC